MPFSLELKELLRNIRPGTTLEVGTSTGKFLPFLTTSDYVGIDLSVNSLRIARKKSSKASLICADAHHLPFREDVFDNVICSRSIKFFHSVPRALSEMTRVSARDARIIITTDYSKSSIWYRLLVPIIYGKMPFEAHWSLEEFVRMADVDPEGKTLRLIRSKNFLVLPPFLYERAPRGAWPVLKIVDKALASRLKGWFFVVSFETS